VHGIANWAKISPGSVEPVKYNLDGSTLLLDTRSLLEKFLSRENFLVSPNGSK